MSSLIMAVLLLSLSFMAVPASMGVDLEGEEGDCSLGHCKKGACSDQGGWKCTREVMSSRRAPSRDQSFSTLRAVLENLTW